ncbi:MAG: phosphatidylinositol kinase [Bacteroidetes bacterium]|nr:MAG: phosphatidylinositol kinase [Bacteroidota bacterium]
MSQGNVFHEDHFAGVITKINDSEYIFQYDYYYVKDFPEKFITFTVPVPD